MARLKGDRLIALGNVGLFKTNYVMCLHTDFGALFAAWQNCSDSGVKKSSLILHIIYSACHLLLFCAFCPFLLHRGCIEIPKLLCMAHPGVQRMRTAYGYFLTGTGFQQVTENKRPVLSYASVRPSLIMPLHRSVFCYWSC